MPFLLLRFVAPMQSWGSRSRFEYRDTEREPTFSGVVGLASAALGLRRNADISWFRDLRMTVRCDRDGMQAQEFQTALDVYTAEGKNGGTQIVRRQYLSDSEFHVALEGPSKILKKLNNAFHKPRFPLFLGRKSYVPVVPVVYPGTESLVETEDSPVAFMTDQLPIRDFREGIPLHRLKRQHNDTFESVETRFVETSDHPTGETRLDIPMSFDIYSRSYLPRNVRTSVQTCWAVRKGGTKWA